MSSEPNSDSGWLELVTMMSDRMGKLSEHVLDNFRELLDAGRRIVNCSETALLIPNAEGTHLRFLVSVNSKPGVETILREIFVPCDRSIVGYVFNTGQMIAIANPDDFFQEVDQKTGLKTSNYLVAPVDSGGEVLGVLSFVNRPPGEPQEPFDEVEIEAGNKLADLAAATLKYYRRMLLQHGLFTRELIAMSQQLTGSDLLAPVDVPDVVVGDVDEQLPLARAMLHLEGLSRREQELAAELIGVLASYADDNDSAY